MMRSKHVPLSEHNKIMTDLCGVLSFLFIYHVVYFAHKDLDRKFFNKIFNKIFPLSEKIVDRTIGYSELKELIGLLHILRAKQAAFFLYHYKKELKEEWMDQTLFNIDTLSDRLVNFLMALLPECDSQSVSAQCVENCALFLSDYSNRDLFSREDESQLKLLINDKASFEKQYENLGVSLEENPILIEMVTWFLTLNPLIHDFLTTANALIISNNKPLFDEMRDSLPLGKEKFESVFLVLTQVIENIDTDALLPSEVESDALIKPLVRLYLAELKLFSSGHPLFRVDAICNELAVFSKLDVVKSADPESLLPQLVRDIRKELNAVQDSPLRDLCVTPVGLEAVFSSTYQSRCAIQSEHRLAVNLILRNFIQPFLSSVTSDPVSPGKKLIFSLYVLSKIYANRFNELIRPDFDLNKAVEGHNFDSFLEPYHPDGDFNYTRFPIGDNFFGKNRGLTNMLATARMLLVGQSFDINFSDFVSRANKYFKLDLKIPSSELTTSNPFIAAASTGEGAATHWLCFLIRSHKDRYAEELVFIYTTLLNKIFDADADKKTKVNAIFCLVFLFGSNPVLRHGGGGAFLTDTLLLSLLYQIGEKPIRKNFLNITEIELLLCFSKDDSASWEKPYQLYEAACRGETNVLFYPIEAGIVPLLATLPTTESMVSCWPNYNAWRLVLFFKIAVSIEETDKSFHRLSDVSVNTIREVIEPFSSSNPEWMVFLKEKNRVSLSELIYFVQENEQSLGVTFTDLEACWMTLAKGDVHEKGMLSAVLLLYKNRIKDSMLLENRVSQLSLFNNAAAAASGDVENSEKLKKSF